LDASGRTVAYELLFRSAHARRAEITDDRMATASVISHAFNELGIAAVLGECRGFINFDAALLMSDVVELLPPQRTVIELLEHVEITSQVVERCRDLKSRGFSFALDDVVHLDDYEPILPCIDVVKVDVLATGASSLPAIVANARARGELCLLAEKVDSREQANRCRALGFELFQGYFFARPTVMEGRRADPSRRVLLRLLEQSLGDVDRAAIETTFKESPELSYKLMRLVNSVGMGVRTSLQSLAHALTMLGRRQLQRWLQVLLYAQQSGGDFSSPLLQLAAARGKLMELLAERQPYDQAYRDRAFMTGILSLLDTLLAAPMTELLAALNLHVDVRRALLERAGSLGHLLQIVEALERTDDRSVTHLLSDGDPCTTAELPQLQIAALAWSNAIGEPSGVGAEPPPAERTASRRRAEG
jgi:EAL and modified HD-GYP domain-containing signal transduction protein